MVIAAHPDDADFGPAATVARWIDEGSTGWLVCCTSGDQGGEDPTADPLALAALRETEQTAAAAIIGYAEWGTRLAVHNSQPGADAVQVAPVPRWGWGVAPPYQP